MTDSRHIQFPGKHAEEAVILLQRRHAALLVGRMSRWFILIFVPVVVQVILNSVNETFAFDPETSAGVLLILGGSAYLLIVVLLAFQDFVDFYLDVLILTNERVIRVEQKGMFNRIVSQLSLDRIQDVTIETKGVLSTALGFGKVTVESAGEQEHFVFDGIPHAEQVQAQILQYARHAPRMGVEQVKTPALKPPPTSKPL